MLPERTHWPVYWADGMKIGRTHLVCHDNALHDSLRDLGGLLLNNLNYGLLPPTPGNASPLVLSCDGQELTLSVCRAITPGGARIELDAAQPALRLPLSDARDEWTRLGQSVGYAVVSVNPFEPQPYGQPDPDEVPLRYPFVMPAYRLSAVPESALAGALSAAYHVPVGRLTLANGVFSLSAEYLPPCRMVGVLPAMQQQYLSIGSRMGEIVSYATAIVVRVRTNARSGQANLLATTIGYLAEATIRTIADNLDSFQLRGSQESPVLVAEFGMRFARSLTLMIRSTPDREKEAMFNYFKNWCGISPVQFETAMQDVLDLEYNHADCQPLLAAIGRLCDVVIALYGKLSQLNYVEKDKDEFFVDRQDTPAPKPANKISFWGK
ncbi:hypothetical protein [Spirosoma montaniterrae]|uniref:Uncharacterized protein n=1 Tax=Spirosoma montaniterrae TaxID=1178516 RepID=A0A1P9WYY5_9BACT|nr:hypothetical protein [Spirosoma montaniterrae]AQG80528.1 hypothetical protein AWR27_15080 [Spirosoma montaniterrae]